MARINQTLLERLSAKLGIGRRQVYDRIAALSREEFLDRDLAALKFAARHGINPHKYASPEDLARLRSGGGELALASAAASAGPDQGERTPKRVTQRKLVGKTPKRVLKKDNSVFVVHGRNEALRRSMYEFLRALGLKPKEWDAAVLEAKGANPNISDIIETAMKKASAVVVLLSPDDEAKLKDRFFKQDDVGTERKLQGQARPNVIFEAGLALGSHPEKTLIVQVGRVKKFSDIAGKHIAHLSNDTARRNDVANRLHKITGQVSKDGSDWMTAGDFSAE